MLSKTSMFFILIIFIPSLSVIPAKAGIQPFDSKFDVGRSMFDVHFSIPFALLR
jgi:hypothetical protein